MVFIEIIKVVVLGLVEGITEWLPISSTGHMLLVDEFIKLNVNQEFKEMFLVVIQLGAIMAVVLLYFHKLNPFSPKKTKEEKKSTFLLWYKVVFACIPGAIMFLLFDDIIDDLFFNPIVIAIALIVYGVLFIVIENKNKTRKETCTDISNLSYKNAFIIGTFQILSLIPGTSRSGSTILGGILFGTSRFVATEFTFFLAIPVMFGASFLKLIKFGFEYSSSEIIILLIGMVTAFITSIIAIKFLLGYLKKHDFKAFGYYRIILGIIVLLYFLF